MGQGRGKQNVEEHPLLQGIIKQTFRSKKTEQMQWWFICFYQHIQNSSGGLERNKAVCKLGFHHAQPCHTALWELTCVYEKTILSTEGHWGHEAVKFKGIQWRKVLVHWFNSTISINEEEMRIIQERSKRKCLKNHQDFTRRSVDVTLSGLGFLVYLVLLPCIKGICAGSDT